nr:putative ribonuclease H-like domain-containing protein [Tanacetum cinerariifolium]
MDLIRLYQDPFAFGLANSSLEQHGKFDGNVDEGFLVGYSIGSKAFRVFNRRIQIVQETLHNTDRDAAFDEKEPEFDEKKTESEVNVSPSSSAQSKKHDDKTKKEEFKDFSDNSINEDNAAGILVPAIGQLSPNSTNTFSDAGPSNATASPTHRKSSSRIEAIRLFLAYASFMGFIVYQMDVKSAFLYGTIEEEVYVCQPPGFKDLDYPDKVYKVVKALYGLHQAPRAWYETLANYLLENGFQRGKIDQTLFVKRQKVKRIFRFLKGKPNLGLWHPKDLLFDLVAYLDSDYAGASLDRKSTTRGCQFLGYRLISWQCKKQTVMASSSTEAEYIADAGCCTQVLWIQNQLLDYG